MNVAVIGAGMAGATCAHGLSALGHAVQVFDRSNGPGGRLATHRVAWVDGGGRQRITRFDHGAPGFTACSPRFQGFVDAGVRAGWLSEWTPTLAQQGLPFDVAAPHYLAVPDMPAICRHLLSGTAASWGHSVEALDRASGDWRLESQGGSLGSRFDAVVLAMPPAQAARLLAAHHHVWARQAALATMQPCWTLMGVSQSPVQAFGWDAARPATGRLAWVARNEARPGRGRPHGEVHWVAHARAGWSRQHIEQPAAWVQLQLQASLAEWLGEPVRWQHALVHRWRYAVPHATSAASAGKCWWDPMLRLGVCGDFLGGGGVEGAWLSAQALAEAMRASWSRASLHQADSRMLQSAARLAA
jgi:renalase